jgi:hypothetical protein
LVLSVVHKRLLRLDAASGADAHCQGNNPTRLAQEVCDWLDAFFARGDSSVEDAVSGGLIVVAGAGHAFVHVVLRRGVRVRTNAAVGAATPEGFRLAGSLSQGRRRAGVPPAGQRPARLGPLAL